MLDPDCALDARLRSGSPKDRPGRHCHTCACSSTLSVRDWSCPRPRSWPSCEWCRHPCHNWSRRKSRQSHLGDGLSQKLDEKSGEHRWQKSDTFRPRRIAASNQCLAQQMKLPISPHTRQIPHSTTSCNRIIFVVLTVFTSFFIRTYSSHHSMVTRSPNHWWANSWATTVAMYSLLDLELTPFSNRSATSRYVISPQFSMAPALKSGTAICETKYDLDLLFFVNHDFILPCPALAREMGCQSSLRSVAKSWVQCQPHILFAVSDSPLTRSGTELRWTFQFLF